MRRGLFVLITLLSLLSTQARSLSPSDQREAAVYSPGDAAPVLRFGVMSDIHVQGWDTVSHSKFRAALRDYAKAMPGADALVINGDLTDGQPEDYQTLRTIVTSEPHPPQVLFAIGNHEFYKAWHGAGGQIQRETFPNGETEAASIARFLSLTGEPRVYYDRWLKDYHFVFLGMEQYRQSNPANLEDAYLSPEQLHWLREKLAEAKTPGKPMFVFLHQPLPGTVSGSSTPNNNRSVIQHQELKAILAQHPEVILFAGHTHWELRLPTTLVRDGFTMVNSSSVRQVWGAPDQPLAPNRSEGLAVDVFPDKVVIRGREFQQQAWIPDVVYEVRVGR